MKEVRLTPKRQLFLDHYFGKANRVATRAAELAGLKWPRTSGPRTRKLLREHIESRERALAESSRMTAEEVVASLTDIARDVDHKDRCRALEMLAKIHGLMSEKVDIKVSREELVAQTMEMVRELKESSVKMLMEGK